MSNESNDTAASCFPSTPQPAVAFIVTHLTLLLGLFGIPGNVLTLVVLRMDKSKTTTRFLLIVLAIQDLILIHLYMLFYAVNHYTDVFHLVSLSRMRHADSVILFFLQWTKMAESYTIVLVSADRFVAIRKPLEAARKCTVNRIAKWLLLNLVVTFLIKLPPLILNFKKAVAYGNCTFLEAEPVFLKEPWYKYFKLFYLQIFDQITSFIIPLILLLVLNVCLILHVRQSAMVRNTYLLETPAARTPDRRSASDPLSGHEAPEPPSRRVQATNKRNSSQRSITFTLIGVITVFVICELPTTFHFIMFVYALKTGTDLYSMKVVVYNYVSMVPLMVINCSFNFFIYVLTGRKFRRLCVRALRLLFLNLKRKCCPCLEHDDYYSHDENQFQMTVSMTQACRMGYSQSAVNTPGFLNTPQFPPRRTSKGNS